MLPDDLEAAYVNLELRRMGQFLHLQLNNIPLAFRSVLCSRCVQPGSSARESSMSQRGLLMHDKGD
jgi:hypothetical protein